MAEDKVPFESYAIVELMGHVKMAGKVTEEEHFGGPLGRIDIPTDDDYVTVYFGHQSIYRITPCDEKAARLVATSNRPAPIRVWELPERISIQYPEPDDEDYGDDWDEEPS